MASKQTNKWLRAELDFATEQLDDVFHADSFEQTALIASKALDRLYDLDPHLGCFSYPMCDESPTGCCIVMGDKVEQFGYKD